MTTELVNPDDLEMTEMTTTVEHTSGVPATLTGMYDDLLTLSPEDVGESLADLPVVRLPTYLVIPQHNSTGLSEGHSGSVGSADEEWEDWIPAGSTQDCVPVYMKRKLVAQYPYKKEPTVEGKKKYFLDSTWDVANNSLEIVKVAAKRNAKERVMVCPTTGLVCKVVEQYVVALFFPKRLEEGKKAWGWITMKGVGWVHAVSMINACREAMVPYKDPKSGETVYLKVPSYWCQFGVSPVQADTEYGKFWTVKFSKKPTVVQSRSIRVGLKDLYEDLAASSAQVEIPEETPEAIQTEVE